MDTDLLYAAHDLAWDCALIGPDHGLRSLAAAAAYSTLAGLGDTAGQLRERGATGDDDATLLAALANLAATIRAEWAAVGVS